MVENETHDFDQQQTGQEPDQMLKEENDAPSQLYQYFVHDNCLYLKDPVKGKEYPELKLLCNFVPFIERQIAYNDGEKVEIKLEVCARMQNGSDCPPVIISAEELDGMKWVTKNWGAECIMEVGAKVKDHIRHMIQCTACKAEKTTVYTVTGWKEINGAYHFLMPGDEAQTVKLQNKMSGYGMQREYEDYDLAVAASFLQETLASKKILYPLIAFVFMSPLNSFLREAKCEPKTVLMLVGKSGSKKSTLSALMLSFFGNFTATSLPLSFKDTANSIMHHAYDLKDVLTCIDDFHPSGKADEQNMKNTMQMILRSYGDRVGRGRLNEKSEALETRFPQGNAIVTAEFPPDIGESGTARYFAVEMTPDSLNNGFLTQCQKVASDGRLNACMFAYTEWIRETFLKDGQLKEKWINALRNRHNSVRDKLIEKMNKKGIEFHPRIPEDVSVMRIGFESFLLFLKAKDILTEEQAESYLLDFDDVMFALASAQNRSIKQDRPAFKFIRKLNSLLESGRYKLAPKSQGKVEPNCNCLGYEDDDYLYLFKSQTHQAVKKLCDDQDESFSISESALGKALLAEQLIIPGDSQITKSVRFDQNTVSRVLVIPKEKMKEILEQFS